MHKKERVMCTKIAKKAAKIAKFLPTRKSDDKND